MKGWSAGRAGSEEGSATLGSMGQNLRTAPGTGQQWELSERERGSGSLWGVSRQWLKFTDVCTTSFCCLSPLHSQDCKCRASPALPSRNGFQKHAQEHVCAQNTLLKCSTHPQTRPASRTETSSRKNKIPGDNEFVQAYT